MIYDDEIEEISEQFEEPEEPKDKKKLKTYESNSTIEDFEKEVIKKTPKPKKSSSDSGIAFSAKWSTVVPIGDGRYRDPDTGKIFWEIKI